MVSRTWFVALVLVAGCKKKAAELPAQVPYALEVAFVTGNGSYVQDHPARGGTLYRGGKPLGPIDTSDHRDRVKFTLPSSDLPSTWGPLEIGLPTPCGEKRIPLEGIHTKASDERAWLAMQLEGGNNGTAQLAVKAKSTDLWEKATIRIEWGGASEPLSIGTIVVQPGTSSISLYAPDCAPDIALRLGDRPFAKLTKSGDHVVLLKPNACFSIESIGYGTAGSAPRIVKTPHLEDGTIDYFLTPPPDQAELVKGTTTTYRTSVQNAACADMPPPDPTQVPPSAPSTPSAPAATPAKPAGKPAAKPKAKPPAARSDQF